MGNPVNRQTDTTENISLATPLADGNKTEKKFDHVCLFVTKMSVPLLLFVSVFIFGPVRGD